METKLYQVFIYPELLISKTVNCQESLVIMQLNKGKRWNRSAKSLLGVVIKCTQTERNLLPRDLYKKAGFNFIL